MHAYRDPIPEARSAVVYSGSADAVFFDDGRQDLSALDTGAVAGVGALSLRPEGGPSGYSVLRVTLGRRVASQALERTSEEGVARTPIAPRTPLNLG